MNRPAKPRALRRRLGLILVVAIVLAIVSPLYSRPTQILDVATFVTDCLDWSGPSFWLSNSEIAGPLRSEPSGLTAVGFNVETGRQRDLAHLLTALKRAQATSNRSTSPDGKWILIDHLDSKPYYDAVSTDGNRYIRWPRLQSEHSSGGAVPWFADSKHWIYVFRSDAGDKAVIRSIDDPLKQAEFRWPQYTRQPHVSVQEVA